MAARARYTLLILAASALYGQQQLVTTTNQLVFCPECSIQSPFKYRNASGSVISIISPVPITVTGGTGLATVAVYVDGLSSNLTVGTFGTVSVSTSFTVVPLSSANQYPNGSLPITMWPISNGLPANAGSNDLTPYAVIGQPPAGAVYNPADQTAVLIDHLALRSGFNRGVEGWDYSGGCGNAAGNTLTAETNFGAVPASAPAGGTCVFYFPSSSNYTSATGGSFDYWSSATPPTLVSSVTYQINDANGTHYIGLSSQAGGIGDFFGCRQIGAGNWFAVIRKAGADVATADTGAAHDSLPHRLTVANNGMAGAVGCGVDGGGLALASGAIPAEPGGWTFVAGAVGGATASSFALTRYVILETGVPVK